MADRLERILARQAERERAMKEKEEVRRAEEEQKKKIEDEKRKQKELLLHSSIPTNTAGVNRWAEPEYNYTPPQKEKEQPSKHLDPSSMNFVAAKSRWVKSEYGWHSQDDLSQVNSRSGLSNILQTELLTSKESSFYETPTSFTFLPSKVYERLEMPQAITRPNDFTTACKLLESLVEHYFFMKDSLSAQKMMYLDIERVFTTLGSSDEFNHSSQYSAAEHLFATATKGLEDLLISNDVDLENNKTHQKVETQQNSDLNNFNRWNFWKLPLEIIELEDDSPKPINKSQQVKAVESRNSNKSGRNWKCKNCALVNSNSDDKCEICGCSKSFVPPSKSTNPEVSSTSTSTTTSTSTSESSTNPSRFFKTERKRYENIKEFYEICQGKMLSLYPVPEKGNQPTSFSESYADLLPQEILISIFQHLTSHRDLLNASAVCLSWNEACDDPVLYKTLMKQRYKNRYMALVSKSRKGTELKKVVVRGVELNWKRVYIRTVLEADEYLKMGICQCCRCGAVLWMARGRCYCNCKVYQPIALPEVITALVMKQPLPGRVLLGHDGKLLPDEDMPQLH